MKLNSIILALFALLVLTPSALVSDTDVTAKTESVVLSKDNLIVINEEINGESVGKAISSAKASDAKLKGYTKNVSKPIYLFLNTPGGSIQSGLELIEALHGLGRPVHTVALFSASMGFQIIQELGDRLILKNGVLMSHRAAGEFSGSFGGENPSQLDSRYSLWLSRLNELDQQTVSRTKGKQTLQSYQKAYANELWLTGSQAVEKGYADKVVTVKCDSSLDGVDTHTVNILSFNITYDLDKCPINTSPMNIRVSSGDQVQKLTPEKESEIRARFLEHYTNKRRLVVPMYW